MPISQTPTPGPAPTPIGSNGATAPTRYVGGTVSGAPTSGTFAVGDFVVDETGQVWVCTGAGTPGAWTGTRSEQSVFYWMNQ